jgi:DNA primase
MKDPQGKTAFHQKVAEKLLTFTEEIERNNYLDAVCETFQIHKDSLKKLLVNLSTRLDTGTMVKKEPLKTGRNSQKGKEDGMKQSQKLLLTWMVEQNGVYSIVKPYISPSDFTEEIYRQVATVLYAQLEQNELNPAKIINLFESEEEHREVAAIFNATLHSLETKADREKALKDTIIRIKKNSIDVGSQTMDPTDIQTLMKIVDDKKMLEKLEKIQIQLPE